MGRQMVLLDGDTLPRLELFDEDTCELVSTIEASFGVKLTKNELIHAKTIRELAELIWKKQEGRLSEKCLSAVVFYQLRRSFISLVGIPRSRIAPETPLRELMPWKNRKKQWRGIQDHLRFALPELKWPLWLVALPLVFVGLLFALGWPRLVSFLGPASWLLAVVGGFCLWVLVLKLLAPLARTLPRSCETVGDLAKLTLARNYSKIATEHGISSERDVLEALRQLIAAEESIDVQKILPDTLFPEGLNIY
jgi:hypothetical protein